jgi:cytochrome c553
MTAATLDPARIMKKLTLTAACVLFATGGVALAADYESGRKKAEQICAACHGPDGNKPLTPETPRLGGQYYDYLVHSLKAYRSGARENPLMSPMAKPLSDQELKDVAWYFSRQPGLVSKY